jgi:malate permease and related proteins
MNQASIHIIETVLAFAMVVLLNVFLKRKGVLRAEDVGVFAKLLTQVVLPAVIFFQFLRNPPAARHLLPILAMLLAGCGTLLGAWISGTALGFSRARTGALMIVSAFGSSALLGYPLIRFTFPHDPEAMTEAILISELAVGLPIFTLCPLVAIHFGEGSESAGSVRSTMLQYFRSPIFIAVVLGFAVSQLHLPLASPFVAPILQAAVIVDGTLAGLACLILGLQIEIKSFNRLVPMVIISALLQMGLQPFLAYGQAILYHLGGLERQVLVLVAAMPSAVLGPVFAVRYKCEGELASTVTFVNIILGAVGIPLAFWLMGR